MVDASGVPNKKYFRIGEVSTLVGVDAHVLRYWETEFKIIKPYRGKSKQRLYRRKDVINLKKIRNLLHKEGYTINGARKLFRKKQEENLQQPTQQVLFPNAPQEQGKLREIKHELQNILTLLEKK